MIGGRDIPTILQRHLVCLIAPLLGAGSACGDTLLYSYEGDVLPYDPSAGWLIFNPCEGVCSESVANGFFTVDWSAIGDTFSYTYIYAAPPVEPPATLWVEWRFHSTNRFIATRPSSDAAFWVDFREINELVDMYGDALRSPTHETGIVGLDGGEWHTHRFESPDGRTFRFSVDGLVWYESTDADQTAGSYLQFMGAGGGDREEYPSRNMWDFIRYGTIEFGETIIACDPQDGLLDARLHSGLDRFTVTFNEPNFVYIDQISVETPVGDPPIVLQTRRLDNGPSETVEVVLDRPIPFGQTTTFTFDDGVAINVVAYTFAPGDTDGDGDADLHDFAMLQRCFAQSPPLGPCRALDLAPDELINPLDVTAFVRLLEAP